MIDFNRKKYCSESFIDDNKKTLESYVKTIQKDLTDIKSNYFSLGCHLTDLYNSSLYGITYDAEKIRLNFNMPIGAGNCCSDCFFNYCLETFDLEKSQVSRMMNIVSEFGNGLIAFKKCWSEFSYSQLVEMLPLSADERKPIKFDWSVRKIREYKKSLVATSQQQEMDLSKDEPKVKERYVRFEKFTREDLCDRIIELETERDNLLSKIKELMLNIT